MGSIDMLRCSTLFWDDCTCYHTEHMTAMRFDDVLDEIGGFGRYQKWVFFLTLGPNLLAGFIMLNPVFLLGIPEHRCAIPNCENDTFEVQSPTHQESIDEYIPLSNTKGLKYDRCNILLPSGNISMTTEGALLPNDSLREACSKWVYDLSVFTDTFASEHNLVCDKEIQVANAEMIFYGGMLVGSLASGIFADVYGRKPVMYVSLVIMVISNIGLAWVHAYWLFVIVEFILGASVIATFMPGYIISLELTSSSKRAWPGVISDFPYVLGLILMAVVAYIVREWFKLQLYTSLPGLLFLSYWWLIPESPRWLLTKGRVAEAKVIIEKAARWNKTVLPKQFFKSKCMDDMDTDKTASFLQLFSSKKMCKTTVIVFVNWTIVAMTYFGLALNSDNLAGNLYLNFGLSAAVEIPAYFLVIYLVDRIGRRWLFTGSMLVGGLACASTVLAIEYEPGGGDAIVVALAMLGKLFITAAYSTAHIHSAELFPTVIRNAGMGGASLFASLGTMVAPYIVTEGEQLGGIWGEAFPLVVFGALAFLTGILSLALPETLGKNLPETVEDGERFGRTGAFNLVRSLRLHKSGDYERIGDHSYQASIKEDSEHELLVSQDNSFKS
ncbi:organic cation transporter protein-like [Mya arenaria]|uniref:organic cation transporter protein-like n=2 Tax=Mya arenaria TaxID=6604 RepID=UPI0022E042F1|nr:organic cation transporter protein-like [Mya arenaria]